MSDSPVWINDGSHNLDIAKFVSEGDEFIEQIVSRAVNELRRTTQGKHWTFASAITEGSPETLGAAVEALYLHLKNDYHLLYEFEKAFDEATGQQQIRPPTMTGAVNRGTCIDLVILFLSCLANAKLWPIYIHLHGRVDHSLAATWLGQPDQHRELFLTLEDLKCKLAAGDLMVIECTGFVEGYPLRTHKIAFPESQEEARKLLEEIDKHGFEFALDVRRAWETGISQTKVASYRKAWSFLLGWYAMAILLPDSDKRTLLCSIERLLGKVSVTLPQAASYYLMDVHTDRGRRAQLFRELVAQSLIQSGDHDVALFFATPGNMMLSVIEYQYGPLPETVRGRIQIEVDRLEFPRELRKVPDRDVLAWLNRVKTYYESIV